MNQNLPVPSAVQKDTNAIELIRVWAALGEQQISIATGVWDNPAAWGILLADLTKHIAKSYGNMDESDVLKSIKQGFDAEWNFPTQ